MEIPNHLSAKVHEAANAHSVIAITDPDGVIVHVNNHFEQVSGYSRKELIGNTHKIINSGMHSEAFFTQLWETISAGKTWSGHICNRDKAGNIYWVDTTIYPALGSDGKVENFISIRTDISRVVFDRNQQKQFRENAEVLNQLVELNVPEFSLQKVMEQSLQLLLQLSWLKTKPKGGIFLVDQAGKKLDLVVENQLGPVKETCQQIKFGQCLCGKVAEQEKTIFASCVDEDHDIRPEGMEPHGHINMPIRGSGGMVGVLVLYLEHGATRNAEHESFLESFCHTLGLIIENRQQRKHLQMSFVDAVRMQGVADRAREAAEHATEAKGNFLASMSHEIRTPMNGVLGMLGLLETSGLNEDQSELVGIANSSARSLMTIINDILDFSKYETSGFSLENKPFDLVSEFNRIILPLKKSAQIKSLILRLEFADDLPITISGDVTRLGQVLTNLLSNAIKFTEYGEVVLRVLKQTTGSTPMLVIKISDSGIGMNEAAQAKVFDRFSQADASITRQFGGTGLGLAIVKQLAEAMDGSIAVRSTPGEGSTFTFAIPLNEAAAQEQQADSKTSTVAARSLRILVAEDHPANQFLMRKLLEAGNHQVVAVENGKMAVDAVQAEPFDMVLMDVQMPVMDGLSATKAIRQLDTEAANIPIIAVTADVMPDQIAKILASGANAHIGKPINPADLFQALVDFDNQSDLEILEKTGT